MRSSLLVGLSLALTAVLAVLVSPLLDLQIESVVLLGAAGGAVVALVPDTTPLARLTGALLGVIAALVGFVLRAAVLPDSTGGRAVAIVVVILASTAVAALSARRVSLWAPLLGAALFAGAYERLYAAAPAELGQTAVSTLTSLLVAMAVGFLAVTWAAPRLTRSQASDSQELAAFEADLTGEDRTDLDQLLNLPSPRDGQTPDDTTLETSR